MFGKKDTEEKEQELVFGDPTFHGYGVRFIKTLSNHLEIQVNSGSDAADASFEEDSVQSIIEFLAGSKVELNTRTCSECLATAQVTANTVAWKCSVCDTDNW